MYKYKVFPLPQQLRTATARGTIFKCNSAGEKRRPAKSRRFRVARCRKSSESVNDESPPAPENLLKVVRCRANWAVMRENALARNMVCHAYLQRCKFALT